MNNPGAVACVQEFHLVTHSDWVDYIDFINVLYPVV
jgi:hypothetical protein